MPLIERGGRAERQNNGWVKTQWGTRCTYFHRIGRFSLAVYFKPEVQTWYWTASDSKHNFRDDDFSTAEEAMQDIEERVQATLELEAEAT